LLSCPVVDGGVPFDDIQPLVEDAHLHASNQHVKIRKLARVQRYN
jgi:hypothetical protein